MKHILIGSLALALSSAALADNYIGATLGSSHIDINCGVNTACESGDTGARIYGGFDVSRRASLSGLALEVGYIHFGTVRASLGPVTTRSVEVSALTFGAAMRVPFTPAFSGVGRLGLAYVDGTTSTPLGSSSSSNLKLHGGLGLEYTLNKQFKLVGAADFTTYDSGADTGSAHLISVGAQYGF